MLLIVTDLPYLRGSQTIKELHEKWKLGRAKRHFIGMVNYSMQSGGGTRESAKLEAMERNDHYKEEKEKKRR